MKRGMRSTIVPNDQKVIFRLGRDENNEITVYREGNWLRIYGSAVEGLIILPRSANVVLVGNRKAVGNLNAGFGDSSLGGTD